jgi:hypothetical protein
VHEFHSLFSGGSRFYVMVVNLEQRLDLALHDWFIVDQQDFGLI